MRLALIGAAAVAVALAAGVSSSEAQFSRRFCTDGGSSESSGLPDCSFNTWEQCMASARGLGRYCTENPFWKPPQRQAEKPRGRSPRRHDN